MDYESVVDLDEDNNLDAKGDYVKCVNCGYKLKAIEKYDDTCLSCKVDLDK